MPDFALKFTDPNACFEFIDLAQRNIDQHGIERRDMNELHSEIARAPGRSDVDETHLTLWLRGVSEPSWESLRRLGRLPPPEQTSRPAGSGMTVEDMLQRVKLVRQYATSPVGRTELAVCVLL